VLSPSEGNLIRFDYLSSRNRPVAGIVPATRPDALDRQRMIGAGVLPQRISTSASAHKRLIEEATR
jgi:antitoxin (DNA-binding transcriptional repressor) of toxin-antitoxin stability system